MAYPPRGYEVTDKRQRSVTYAAAKRPIDKVMTTIFHSGVNATDVTTTIYTATFPCTMTGLRWSLTFNQDGGVAQSHFVWAIIYLREGETIDGLVITDGLTFYKPESSVLVWGYGGQKGGHLVDSLREGTTKTMRKMQAGDIIAFIMKGIATETTECAGAVQLFVKG